MKRLVFFLTIIVIASCNTRKDIPFTIFKGKIENAKGVNLVIKGIDYEHEVKVKEDGTFFDTLYLEENYYTIEYNNEITKGYLKKGYVLHLAFDANEFDETILYNGWGAIQNNFIAQKILTEEEHLSTPDSLYALEMNEFLRKITNVKNALETSLALYDLKDSFALHERINISFDFMLRLQRYPSYHKHYAEKDTVILDSTFLLPVGFVSMDYEKGFDMFENYREIVKRNYFDQFDENATGLEMLAPIKKYKSKNIVNAIVQEVSYYLSAADTNLEAFYQELNALSSDEEFKTKLLEKYEKLKNLTAGNPSPKFAYKNIEGTTVSLDDLKGKLVYVDVWATWCGPCKREIPHLKALEEEFRKQSIAFVSISIDKEKDYNKWKEMVNTESLKGIQLFADKDWKSDFVKDYAIDGIPRFILIDQRGNIISSDAPRPSSGEEIKSLLKMHL
jgi:thiol-disulfide isomerase/thioredoxin